MKMNRVRAVIISFLPILPAVMAGCARPEASLLGQWRGNMPVMGPAPTPTEFRFNPQSQARVTATLGGARVEADGTYAADKETVTVRLKTFRVNGADQPLPRGADVPQVFRYSHKEGRLALEKAGLPGVFFFERVAGTKL